ncbi:unnamed protein product [Pleuronectes platessa]|uniref:Uncharacterized protein n=1 Tax=Pleuronectes platessa TaxID=8262 RepID=A0A9N7VU20_PLEPL|nr:unnamed protein product [Pleuronectes platessa]
MRQKPKLSAVGLHLEIILSDSCWLEDRWFHRRVTTHVVSHVTLKCKQHGESGTKVRTIAVSHTFKIDKAHRELGYCPKPYSLEDSVELYLKSQQPRSTSPLLHLSWSSQLPRPLVLLLLLGFTLMLLAWSCLLNQS